MKAVLMKQPDRLMISTLATARAGARCRRAVDQRQGRRRQPGRLEDHRTRISWLDVSRRRSASMLPASLRLVGAGVTGFAPGDRVYYHGSFAGLGAYAEQVVTRSHVVAKLPDSVAFEVAAAIPTAGFTAFQVIEDRFRVGPQRRRADSCRGRRCWRNSHSIGEAQRRDRHHARVRPRTRATFGASAPITTSTMRRGCRNARRGTDARARRDAILDTVGPSVGGKAIAMLAFQGHLACCVGLPDLTSLQPLPRGVQIADIALGWAYLSGDTRAQARLAHYGAEMAQLVVARRGRSDDRRSGRIRSGDRRAQEKQVRSPARQARDPRGVSVNPRCDE